MPSGRPSKLKLGIQTEHEDPYQRQAPWPPRSKVKVARSRDTSDRCWPISGEWNVLETPKLVGRYVTHPTGNNAYVSRSKVKVTLSITLHNNTSFRTTITFYSHSLSCDTSTNFNDETEKCHGQIHYWPQHPKKCYGHAHSGHTSGAAPGPTWMKREEMFEVSSK